MSMNNITNQGAPNYGSANQRTRTALPSSADSTTAMPPAQANSGDTVDLGLAQRALILADDNHDGVTDRQELANAAYQILNNPNATGQDVALGSLFASFVLGGKDGQGLNPDINRDGGVTGNELALLAKGDDQSTQISKKDIAQAFGSQVNQNGNSFTLSDLQTIAQGEQPNAAANATTADATNSQPTTSPEVMQSILESTTSIVNSLNKILQSQQSSETTPAEASSQAAQAAETAPVAKPQAPAATNATPAESAPPAATDAGSGTPALLMFLSVFLKIINLLLSKQGAQ